MKAQRNRIALALAAALIGVSSMVGADVTPGRGATIVADSRDVTTQDSPRIDSDAGTDGHRNSPHPAVLSYERPVFPIGVPNPPVSLERY